MLRLSEERAAVGWAYRIGGFRNRSTGYSVTRNMSWEEGVDDPPEWWVRDRADEVVGKFSDLDEAMNFAEATYELKHVSSDPTGDVWLVVG